MHAADLPRGFIGGNGIVGGGLGLALGAALSARVRRSGQVAVGFVGDGGMNTGRTWEFVNLATVWGLPLLIVCENNLYAVETPVWKTMASSSIVERAEGFGIQSVVVDGQDVAAIHHAVATAADRARAGDGPTFVEARTYRFEGHNTGQAITYRTADEVAAWRATRDPISRLRQALASIGALDDLAFEAFGAAAREEVDDAVAFAEAAPWPEPGDAMRGVTALGESVRRLA
jgi:TPP-dependent pyruvate/acetoin dehydrogenase alpha subunit